ncbi:ligand-gated channel [Croceicoccus ponticola]|uniref:Ligand-gated channel n=1 Tax=Croceicoccus ponticola TaxID=2217664 RepID=A0A437GZ94_9SPHN|nr:TonB-dependent receptor [Croceicoccus ponticola]RVQ68677.1 ligand-gated channel [Croceicoccus ponticola]
MSSYGKTARAGRTFGLLVAASTFAIAGGTAHAQNAGPVFTDTTSEAAEVPPASGGLQEIVVTARKRVESAQDVPVSVTAISAQEINDRDLTSLENVAAATPQLAIGRNATGSGAQLTLRGIGSNSLSIGTEQSIAVIVDGVYYGQGRTINEGFFDLGGIEILKGPQSLFFGKNATAGVISISTADPTDHFTASSKTSYEFNAGKLREEVILSGPIGDTLGFRLAGRVGKDFGYLFDNRAGSINYVTTDRPSTTQTNATTNHLATAPADNGPREREILLRGTLEWEASDRLTARLTANYGYNRTSGTWNYAVFACEGGFSHLSPGVPCERDFSLYANNMPADIAAQTRFARDDGKNFNKYSSWGMTGTIDYDFDDLMLTSVTNYQWNRNIWSLDLDYQSASSPSLNIWGSENSKYDAFSEELRLLSQFDGPLNFLLGGYYQTSNRGFEQNVLFAGFENSAAPDGFRYVAYAKDSSTKGKTVSGYGQLIWEIVPETLEATGGVRYIHETKDSFFVQPYAHPLVNGTRYAVNQPLTADQTFDNWSPEATLTWTPTTNITLYGAYKTAYKSGGFSNSSIQSPVTPLEFFLFEPEKAKGFEVGLKTDLLDRQLRFNVTAYNYEFTNLQVTYLDSAALSYNSVNAGSARTKGVEVEFAYAPNAIAGFQINGSANYNRSRYGDAISPCYGGQSLDNGCIPNLLSPGTPGQNLEGLPTSDAPDWTGSLGARYETPLGDAMRFGLSFDGRYSSDYLTSSFGSPLSRQGSYVTLDAGVKVGAENDAWEIALLGKNLTNHFIVTGVTDGSGTGSGTGTNAAISADQVGFVAMPRTVTVQVTLRIP